LIHRGGCDGGGGEDGADDMLRCGICTLDVLLPMLRMPCAAELPALLAPDVTRLLTLATLL